MKKTYDFFEGEEPLLFDDTKSVRELIQYAFDRFGYYEPAGMEIVTLFQPQARTTSGWFTTDASRACADEITVAKNLCFAYHKPNAFYFAEGGWGHHMLCLGNHPQIDNPVLLHLRFENFNHSVVINGGHTFKNIIRYLMQTGYLEIGEHSLLIHAINPYKEPYLIAPDNELMCLPLTEFEKTLPYAVIIIDIL